MLTAVVFIRFWTHDSGASLALRDWGVNSLGENYETRFIVEAKTGA